MPGRLTPRTKLVFSRSLDSAEDRNTRIVRENLHGEILKLKQESGKDVFQFSFLCFYDDSASGRHRVSRIDHQIHQDLFDLTRIDLNATERCTRSKLNLNVLKARNLPKKQPGGGRVVHLSPIYLLNPVLLLFGVCSLLPAAKVGNHGQ